MENKERRFLLREALNLIEEAQELCDEAVRGTANESEYKGTGRCGMETALGNGNPYDLSIPKLINELRSVR